MKKLFSTFIIWGSILIFGCSSSEFNESKIAAQPELSLVAPNGIRLANSTQEIIRNSQPSFEQVHGAGVKFTVTKISFGGVAPFEEEAAKDGMAVAKIYFKTSKGQVGDFTYVGKAESNVN